MRIRIRNLYADPDPDPAAQINADPCGSGYGSGSETLLPVLNSVKRVQLISTEGRIRPGCESSLPDSRRSEIRTSGIEQC